MQITKNKKSNKLNINLLDFYLAVWTGLEPATPCVTGRYSNQLNYHTIVFNFEPLFSIADAKIHQKFESARSFDKIISKKDYLSLCTKKNRYNFEFILFLL